MRDICCLQIKTDR